MRDACRKAFAAIILSVCLQPAYAQEFPNGLSSDSVSPSEDSLLISAMRHHMDSIRTTLGRPTVALVLSGGGAKGAAEVGAKKAIDELGIPVDMICGTSIGGLVGGLMSLGYSCEFIDSLFTHQQWEKTLTDKVDPVFIPLDTKMYMSKHILSVPFHYQKETFEKRVQDQEKYEDKDGKLHLGAYDDAHLNYGTNNMASSLPAGYAYGFNINNLLASLSVGYQDSIAFRDLPVPFFCVAADMISCKAKYWGSGSVKTAMRSTMSIPGLFNPVRTQGMVLVDGGVRNNFPVDIARAIGADYIIGIELSDMTLSYSQVNNIGNILSQFIDMLGKDAHDRNINGCDVFIKPDLKGYNMLSFNPEAIDTMMARGYRAALDCRDELLALKEAVGTAGSGEIRNRAVDISRTPVLLGSVIFEGLTDRESKYLQKKIKLYSGQYVTAGDINDAMSKIQATGCFEAVTYDLLGKEEPYNLVFNCMKGPVHQLGLGIRADNIEWVSLLVNLGLNTHKLMGSKLDVSLKIGLSKYADVRYSLDLPNIPTLNADFKISSSSGDLFEPDMGRFTVGFWSHRERIYLSNMKWTRLNIRAGIENKFFKLPPERFLSTEGYALPEKVSSGTYGSAFVNAGLFTMDDLYYPSHGTNFNMGYELTLAKVGRPEFKPYNIFSLNWRHAFPIGGHFAIIPDLHVRCLFNRNTAAEDISFGLSNYVGGGFSGRYLDQAVPLAGFKEIYVADDHLAVLNLALRVSPFKNFYITAEGGVLKESDLFKEWFRTLKPDFGSAALGVGYDSIFGPLDLSFQWSQLVGFGYLLSLGFDF